MPRGPHRFSYNPLAASFNCLTLASPSQLTPYNIAAPKFDDLLFEGVFPFNRGFILPPPQTKKNTWSHIPYSFSERTRVFLLEGAFSPEESLPTVSLCVYFFFFFLFHRTKYSLLQALNTMMHPSLHLDIFQLHAPFISFPLP